jgi:hypothetical protein
MMAEKEEEKREYRRESPVSLSPLSFKEAIAALLQVKPKGDEDAVRVELTSDQVRILCRLEEGEEIQRPSASDPTNSINLEREGLRREFLVTWPPYGESSEPVPVTLTDRGLAIVEAIHRQK